MSDTYLVNHGDDVTEVTADHMSIEGPNLLAIRGNIAIAAFRDWRSYGRVPKDVVA